MIGKRKAHYFYSLTQHENRVVLGEFFISFSSVRTSAHQYQKRRYEGH